MVFSSAVFIFVFLPVFLLADKILRKTTLRNIFIILSSLLFYIWGEGFGVFILISLAFVNLIFGKLISLEDKKFCCFESRKLFFLIVGVSLNILCLFYFKYLSNPLLHCRLLKHFLVFQQELYALRLQQPT